MLPIFFLLTLFFIVLNLLNAGLKKGKKKSQVHLNVTRKSAVTENLECGVSVAAMYMEYGVEEQMVSGIRKTKSPVSYSKSSSCDVEGTSCCSEGGSRELIKPAKQADLGETVTKIVYRTTFLHIHMHC
jgi:hypothetical protein